MYISRETRAKLKDLENQLTLSLKERIKELDLIDTGAMYQRSRFTVKLTDIGFDLDVVSTYYFPILDSRYGLVDYVLKLPIVNQKIGTVSNSLVDDLIKDV